METFAWISAEATEFGVIEPLKIGPFDAYASSEGLS
jgi:hypothetical protein